MTTDRIAPLLKLHGLRDTQARRLVVEALRRQKKAMSAQEIRKAVSARGSAINAVTVYRVLEVLERLKVVHRHPCSGNLTLCTMPDQAGHHGFLHCSSCHEVEEFASPRLCEVENEVAREKHFLPHQHVCEIIGICSRCVS